jgi:hypothetical protein
MQNGRNLHAACECLQPHEPSRGRHIDEDVGWWVSGRGNECVRACACGCVVVWLCAGEVGEAHPDLPGGRGRRPGPWVQPAGRQESESRRLRALRLRLHLPLQLVLRAYRTASFSVLQ